MSGVISDTKGRLPAINITDPYSPMALANAKEKPVKSAGQMAGNIILGVSDFHD